MSRYIDADAFDDTVQTLNEQGWNITRIDYKRMDRVLFEMPTADVVEVVRCKDCEFWQTDWIPNTGGDRGCHYCEMMDSFTEPLNYCGCAERKILPKD